MNKGIVIAGPTGVGKTKISIELAKKFDAEIISADSAQVYEYLNIGTAKVSEDEKENIVHYMLDIVEPIRKYNVGTYEREANKILNSSTKNFLIVGGTGLYIKSLTDGLSELPPADLEIKKEFLNKTNEELFNELLKYDEEACKNIHINNRVRIERALEVCIKTGEKFSKLSKINKKNNDRFFLKIALERDRDELYDRINKRVDLMFEAGLLNEVKNLYEVYGEDLHKLNIIGYNELIRYFRGEYTLEKAKTEIKKNSRHYAKRQFTWFKADKSYRWFNLSNRDEKEVLDEIIELFLSEN